MKTQPQIDSHQLQDYQTTDKIKTQKNLFDFDTISPFNFLTPPQNLYQQDIQEAHINNLQIKSQSINRPHIQNSFTYTPEYNHLIAKHTKQLDLEIYFQQFLKEKNTPDIKFYHFFIHLFSFFLICSFIDSRLNETHGLIFNNFQGILYNLSTFMIGSLLILFFTILATLALDLAKMEIKSRIRNFLNIRKKIKQLKL